MANVQITWSNSAFAELARSLSGDVAKATNSLCAQANARANSHDLLKGHESLDKPAYACDTRVFPGSAVGIVHPNSTMGIIDQNKYHTLNSVAH